MDNAAPAVFLTERTQIHEPDIGSAGRHQQARETHGVCKVQFVQLEATTLLVREKRFDPQSFAIQATRFLS